MQQESNADDGIREKAVVLARNPYQKKPQSSAISEPPQKKAINDFFKKQVKANERKGEGAQNLMGSQSQQRIKATRKVRQRKRYQLKCYASKPIPGQCQQCIEKEIAQRMGKAPPHRGVTPRGAHRGGRNAPQQPTRTSHPQLQPKWQGQEARKRHHPPPTMCP